MQFSYNQKPIAKYLAGLQAEQAEPFYYVANPGNAGDAAIALGTFHLLDRLGIDYRILSSENLPPLEGKTILFSGGGNLVQGLYDDLYNIINRFVDGNRCIVLPHTIFGYEDLISRVKSGNLTVFCRDKTSYNVCVMENGLDSTNIFLDDDLAFSINEEFLRPYREKAGCGTANCFRTDSEAAGLHPVPKDNRDISFSWNGALWFDKEFTESVVRSLLIYLSAYESVRTDRLHVAILAAMLGRNVFLFPNSYYKNRSVFEMSLKKYPKAYFVNTSTDLLHSEYVQYLLDKNGITK